MPWRCGVRNGIATGYSEVGRSRLIRIRVNEGDATVSMLTDGLVLTGVA